MTRGVTDNLPEKFREYLLDVCGESNAEVVLDAICNSEPVVSVRINPLKVCKTGADEPKQPELNDIISGLGSDVQSRKIPWCEDGYYLSERPLFTLDPAFHAGAYYVQEPSSMFLAVLGPVFDIIKPAALLDLCAAPGGKTTHIISMMPRGAKLMANEVIHSRLAPLRENVAKWGDHSVEVVSMDSANFKNSLYDFVLVDAPCSGEGMFRKDHSAIGEWSEENVKLCAARQRRILADIWDSVKVGGLLAYSTCTFNKFENDENVAWLKSTYEAEIFDLFGFYSSNGMEERFNARLVEQWGIIQTKEGGFQFFPGLVKGEGYFFALLRKTDGKAHNSLTSSKTSIETSFMTTGRSPYSKQSKGKQQNFKKTVEMPEHEDAIAMEYTAKWPSVELSKEEALQYLSRNAIKLREAPLGYVRVTYKGLGLGFVKNLGERANNLYPTGWRIRHFSF